MAALSTVVALPVTNVNGVTLLLKIIKRLKTLLTAGLVCTRECFHFKSGPAHQPTHLHGDPAALASFSAGQRMAVYIAVNIQQCPTKKNTRSNLPTQLNWVYVI